MKPTRRKQNNQLSAAALLAETVEKIVAEGVSYARKLGFQGDVVTVIKNARIEIEWWAEAKSMELSEYDMNPPPTPQWNRLRCLDALPVVLDPLSERHDFGPQRTGQGPIDEWGLNELHRFAHKAASPPDAAEVDFWAKRRRAEEVERAQQKIEELQKQLAAARKVLEAA